MALNRESVKVDQDWWNIEPFFDLPVSRFKPAGPTVTCKVELSILGTNPMQLGKWRKAEKNRVKPPNACLQRLAPPRRRFQNSSSPVNTAKLPGMDERLRWSFLIQISKKDTLPLENPLKVSIQCERISVYH
jgi:hypothetical protein